MCADIYGSRSLILRDIPLTSAYFRKQVEKFVTEQGLTPDLPGYMAGIFDEADDTLLACGGLEEGSLIKCMAVHPEARQLNLAGKLVTHLTDRAMSAGATNVTVFTKPENRDLFRSMGFHLTGQASSAIMMERDSHALTRYTDYLKTLRKEGTCGAIVMNANPLTRGHLYLIGEARKCTDHLYIILVSDHKRTLFSYKERKAMLEKETHDMPDVTVVEGSIYSVSAATFPSYFIKEKSRATEAHIELDLDIFSRHLAPALGVTKRFVGQEPIDALTAAYNEGMHRLLPPRGIEVIEVPRCKTEEMADDASVISATQLRNKLQQGETAEALKLAATAATPYILAKAATTALLAELDLTPKPGLVDRDNNGAHSDMDYALMACSIQALEPAFRQIAVETHRTQQPDCTELARIGREGEAKMLQATGGVNTHKGALFALGLTTAATSHLLAKEGYVKTKELRTTIAQLAAKFQQPATTHGAAARKKYGAQGALDNALTGYAKLFDKWLPYWISVKERAEARHLLLLKIMADIDDTNVLHRAGQAQAAEVKMQAAALLNNFSTAALQTMDREFIARHISPGGAADMLALTLYVAGICRE